jgi:hypothetical protein
MGYVFAEVWPTRCGQKQVTQAILLHCFCNVCREIVTYLSVQPYRRTAAVLFADEVAVLVRRRADKRMLRLYPGGAIFQLATGGNTAGYKGLPDPAVTASNTHAHASSTQWFTALCTITVCCRQ